MEQAQVPSPTEALRSPYTLSFDMLTCTGNWAIEVAQVYPFAEVIGMDISPVTPQAPIPTNCRFVKGDVTDDLPSRFGNGRFDLVHSRYPLNSVSLPFFLSNLRVGGTSSDICDRGLMGGVYETAWDHYIRDIYEILIPDHGHAQIIEFSLPKWANGSLPPNSALAEYYSLMAEGHRRRGTISSGGSHLQQRMRNAGFVDIQVTAKYVAVGDWPGEAKTVEEANFRRATSRCFFENVRDLVEDQPIFKEAYPSRVERKKFADRVWEECYVGRYPLYIEVYFPFVGVC